MKMQASCYDCDYNFYWSNNALQRHAAFTYFIVYFWYIECYIFTVTLNCKNCSKRPLFERLQESRATRTFVEVGGRAHSSWHGSWVPAGCCIGSARPCTKCTLLLHYTVLGRQARQELFHSCIPSLFLLDLRLLLLCNFSPPCRTIRVLTFFPYWQY